MKNLSEAQAGSDETITGIGFSIGHHGELLQGVFRHGEKNVRALITLPCANYLSVVTIKKNGQPGIEVWPSTKKKTHIALHLLLEKFDMSVDPGFHVVVRSNIPEGKGLGSSTADITAAFRALSNLLHQSLNEEMISAYTVKAETASDPLIYGFRPVLFAQREGHALACLAVEFPDIHVLSLDLLPNGTFDTLANKPCNYEVDELRLFQSLLEKAKYGFFRRDIKAIAEVATCSANINQRHYPKPHFAQLQKIATNCGAIGLQTAHSGTVSGLLFDPSQSDHLERVKQAQTSLARNGIQSNSQFSVPNSHMEVAERAMTLLLAESSPHQRDAETVMRSGNGRPSRRVCHVGTSHQDVST